jgi:quinol monooxygenase YgiN
MTAYNVVRMRVKPGQEQAFIDLHRTMDPAQHDRMRKNGFRKYAVIKTGDRTYCFIGEWDSMDAIVKSRPDMIADLDKFRGMLEDDVTAARSYEARQPRVLHEHDRLGVGNAAVADHCKGLVDRRLDDFDVLALMFLATAR